MEPGSQLDKADLDKVLQTISKAIASVQEVTNAISAASDSCRNGVILISAGQTGRDSALQAVEESCRHIELLKTSTKAMVQTKSLLTKK